MKKIILIAVILSLTFTTGCWDMKEINERIFPYSVGLDIVDKKDFKKGRYEITFTYPNINALGKQAIQEDIVYLASIRGNNMFEGASNVSDRLQKPMFLRDLKVVVIPESLARDKNLIKEIIDGLSRDYIVNKVINFVVVKTTAKDFMQTVSKSKKQTEIEGLLYGLLRNEQGSTKFINSTLNSFVKDMYSCGATLVPVARREGEDIIVDSNAVFKDYELIGYLNQEDNRNIGLLTNKTKDLSINTEYEGADLALRTPRPRLKKQLIKSEKNLKIRYSIELRGQMEEYILGRGDQLDNKEKVNDMEKTLEKDLKKSIEKTIEKLQKDLNTDTIGVAEHLYKFNPKIWEEIEDDFDDIFPHIDIDLDINITIRRRGLTK
ncbi:Ger(x)C family spore germination protein [Tissierella creatinophila]|uniref:Spore germination protein B3 n=1 Tax=Tissierella creatinophila DSM 6911 TaxID=1123403 RepID=A0A1U7M4M8_TISCR|nr:Ger(x)C family spore germination protein [Tissierella creatinophila]OLS02272.1 spore germination protein B3 precursor [Tissierella creatinophila DSM 6911]